MDEIMDCDGSPFAIACIAKKMLNDNHVCVKRGTWYEFDGTLWQKHRQGYRARQELSESILKRFISAVSNLMSQLTMDDHHNDTVFLKEIKKKCAKLSKIALKLQNRTFKDRCLCEMTKQMRDPDFAVNLDSNTHLIAFKNGVWDLKQGRFRRACKEDFLYTNTHCDYYDVVNADIYARVEQYWESLHPDEVERASMINTFVRELHWRAGENKYNMTWYQNIERNLATLLVGDRNDPCVRTEFMRYVLRHYKHDDESAATIIP